MILRNHITRKAYNTAVFSLKYRQLIMAFLHATPLPAQQAILDCDNISHDWEKIVKVCHCSKLWCISIHPSPLSKANLNFSGNTLRGTSFNHFLWNNSLYRLSIMFT